METEVLTDNVAVDDVMNGNDIVVDVGMEELIYDDSMNYSENIGGVNNSLVFGIVIAVGVVLGIVLGIILGKRAANK